jgi:LPXTG-motif cell wall-anchored protein
MAVSAFAAGSINANEQKVLDELTAKNVPASQIEKVKAEFMKDGVDVTADEANTAVANVDKAKAIVDAKGYTTLEQLKADTATMNEVVAIVNSTAKAVGVNVTVSVAADGKVSTSTSTNGSSDASIGKTGVDFSTTAAVVAGLGLSVAGIAVFAKKNDLVNA